MYKKSPDRQTDSAYCGIVQWPVRQPVAGRIPRCHRRVVVHCPCHDKATLAACLVRLSTHTHTRTHAHTHTRTSRVSRICSQVLVNILGICGASPEEEKDGYNVMSMWSLRWHFTNRSVTGAPYSIKGYSYSPPHSRTLWWRVQWLLGKIRRKGSF